MCESKQTKTMWVMKMKRFQRGAVLSIVMAMLAFSPATARDILIENVTLIDGLGRAPTEGISVLIADDRIDSITAGLVEVPSDVHRIDGSGKYLIPGLIDTHIHLRGGRKPSKGDPRKWRNGRKAGVSALASYVYSGVTSIYDAGNVPTYIMKLRADERSGKISSPRIFATGGIVTYPGSHGGGPGATLVDDWPEAIPALEAHLENEPDLVKFTLEERGWGARPLIPMLPIDLLQHLIEFYNDKGVRTTVHTSSELRARQAIFAGVDTLAHPVIQGPISEGFAKLMGVKKIPMSSTLTIGENYSRLAEHPEYLDQPLYRAALAAEEIEELKNKTSKEFNQRSWTWWMKIMTPIAQENLRQIYAAGGVLALGTDQSSGPAVHREMELLVDAGIAPLDVITIATRNGAIFLGIENTLGTIEAGKLADMVLLNADPSADINNAKLIHTVIKNGEIIDRSKLPLAGAIE